MNHSANLKDWGQVYFVSIIVSSEEVGKGLDV
jgi:hypothetical protein